MMETKLELSEEEEEEEEEVAIEVEPKTGISFPVKLGVMESFWKLLV